MGWKTRAVLIGTVWIVVPWTWGMVDYQLRRRRSGGGEDATS